MYQCLAILKTCHLFRVSILLQLRVTIERESARVNHRLPPIFWEENVRGGNYAIEEGEMYLH